jgi:hypothetical protein
VVVGSSIKCKASEQRGDQNRTGRAARADTTKPCDDTQQEAPKMRLSLVSGSKTRRIETPADTRQPHLAGERLIALIQQVVRLHQ